MSAPLIGGGTRDLAGRASRTTSSSCSPAGNSNRRPSSLSHATFCLAHVLSALTLPADEVNAIVLDIGTYQAKAGYAGEDAPKFSCPTQLGVAGSGQASHDAMDVDQRQFKAGIGALETAVDGMEVVSPFKDGVLDDWEAVEALCEHLLKSQMRLNTEEHAMMLAEPSYNTDSAREKMVELMFENYNVPAVFLTKNAVLSSFAMGKPTSLVVDMGHESTVGACLSAFR